MLEINQAFVETLLTLFQTGGRKLHGLIGRLKPCLNMQAEATELVDFS